MPSAASATPASARGGSNSPAAIAATATTSSGDNPRASG